MNAVGWAVSVLFWPFLGWIGDLPRNVGPRENVFAIAGQWTSTVFHVGGALMVSIINPLWGLIWALFAGVVLARRLAASGPEPVPLDLDDIRSEIGGALPYGWGVFAVAIAAPLSWAVTEMPSLLGWVQGWLALSAPAAMIVLLTAAGLAHKRWILDQQRNAATWAPRLATILGVAPSIIVEQALITVRPSDGAVRFTVPAAAAPKLAPQNRGAVDEQIAAVAPEYMLDPASTHEVAYLVPVDPETAQRRIALAESGGLVAGITGEGPAPVEGNVANGMIVITEEDLR